MITSRQNPHVKEIRNLQKKKERDLSGRFLVEGSREISLISPDLIETVYSAIPILHAPYKVFEMSRDLIEELTYRGGDAIAIVKMQKQTLGQASLIVAADGLEKPGNLGALMRTADAAGFDAVISVGGGVDLYSPNVIRASLGTFFTQTVCEMTAEDLIAHCKKHSIELIVATPEAPLSLFQCQMPEKLCLVIGSEAFGVREQFKQIARCISLPMYGKIDSLNASTSFAIIAYEIIRQRNFI